MSGDEIESENEDGSDDDDVWARRERNSIEPVTLSPKADLSWAYYLAARKLDAIYESTARLIGLMAGADVFIDIEPFYQFRRDGMKLSEAILSDDRLTVRRMLLNDRDMLSHIFAAYCERYPGLNEDDWQAVIDRVNFQTEQLVN